MVNKNFGVQIKILSLLLLSFLWSSLIFFYWSYDYGLYYNQAVNLSNDYKIYSNFFDTKGPLYYLFIKIISQFIGIGKIQSYITLGLTTFLFFLSIFLIINQRTKKNFLLLFFFLISILHQQNINISLVLFQFSLQITSFFFLLQFLEKENKKYFLISTLFYALSLFSKIDVIIYLPIYLLIIFFINKNKKYIISFILFSLIMVYLILSYLLDFNLRDFWWHNYLYNSQFSSGFWNREPFLKIFNSPYHIYLIMFTGVGVLFFEIVDKIFTNAKVDYKNYFNVVFRNRVNFFQILILSAGIFVWLYSGSDKNYHVYMVFLPLILIICYNFNLLDKFNYRIFFYYLLTFFFFLITLYPDTKNVISNKCWKKNIYCYQIDNYGEIVNEINNLKDSQDIIILGSAGWPYLLSGAKLKISLANYTMYSDIMNDGKRAIFDRPKALIADHNNLMKRETDFIFWVEKSLINNFENSTGLVPSIYLRELLEKSTKIKLQGNFYKYKIN